MGDHHLLRDPMIKGDSHPAAQNDGERGSSKGAKSNDVVSTITGDSLIIFYKKIHLPIDLMAKYATWAAVSPPLKLIDISARCGVSLAQFLHKAMSVTMGLIAFFRDRGAVLTLKYLLWMGQFIIDTEGRDPLKSWAHAFFYVENGLGIIEKWGRMNDLHVPLYVGEDDILRILNISDVEHLLFEVRYLTKYIEEESLFKVGLLIQAGRSKAKMLKKSSKVHEPPAPSSKVPSKQKSDDPQALLKKKKLEGISTSTSQVPPDSSSAKLHIPGDVLKHQCLGRCKADDLVKYLQGEYKRKYNHKTKEVKVLEVELIDCRTELANIITATSLKSQQIDRL
ncbi:hypothetical protein IEQ34_009140 [Dendrobium chrysotoxum]|uniref:Uncharacterized protein n=1 Tax=Dendrobium chrysotoxum TaxID=161865 RepID=A0AAV7GIB8_DENCH|nr:hypothetical protein IEQ34_009140 [Dendrobium chrysotoxum]